jgi:hypothetical protein
MSSGILYVFDVLDVACRYSGFYFLLGFFFNKLSSMGLSAIFVLVNEFSSCSANIKKKS